MGLGTWGLARAVGHVGSHGQDAAVTWWRWCSPSCGAARRPCLGARTSCAGMGAQLPRGWPRRALGTGRPAAVRAQPRRVCMRHGFPVGGQPAAEHGAVLCAAGGAQWHALAQGARARGARSGLGGTGVWLGRAHGGAAAGQDGPRGGWRWAGTPWLSVEQGQVVWRSAAAGMRGRCDAAWGSWEQRLQLAAMPQDNKTCNGRVFECDGRVCRGSACRRRRTWFVPWRTAHCCTTAPPASRSCGCACRTGVGHDVHSWCCAVWRRSHCRACRAVMFEREREKKNRECQASVRAA